LLSTVHWGVKENPNIKDDIQSIVAQIHNWNERERKIFKEEHIEKILAAFKKNSHAN
jgi:hypothetical protein